MCATFSRFGSTKFLSLLVLLAAGCVDHTKVIGPATTVARIAAVEVQPSHLVECTTTWKDPVNGLWTEAAKWSAGVVPGVTDDVCITVDGTYKVGVRGAQLANTVTVGKAGNTGVQTLGIEGVGTGSSLTATAGFINEGVVQLTWVSGTNGTASVLAVTTGTLTNAGTLRTVADGIGAPRAINANLVNTGTVSIGHPTSFNKAGGVYENQGTFTIETFRSLNIAGNLGQVFRQAAGTLTVSGTMSITQETLEFSGGTIVGRPTITNGTLRIGAGSEGAGDFAIRGASTLAGDIASTQSVRIQGTGTGSTLTAASGFTNAGTIELSWVSGTNVTEAGLAVTAGTLTNTGTIRSLADGIGAPRIITADLLNAGTIRIEHPTTFNKPGGQYENRGDFTIDQFRSLTIQTGAGQVFRQADGTLVVTGSMVLNDQTFEAVGGTITGRPVLNSGTLRFVEGCTGTGDFSVRGTPALEGDIPAGYTVRVNTSGSVSSTLTAAAGFVNHGTIELDATSGNNSTAVNLAVTTGTLTNSGILRTLNDAFSGTGRTIAANVLNTGTVDIQTRTTFAKQNGTHVNQSLIMLGAFQVLTINGLGQTLTTTGQITGGGTLAFTSMTLRASGSIAATMNLTNVDSHIGTGGPATLDVTGTYRMITGGTMNIELADPTPGTGHDRLNVSGAATLLGTLNVTVVEGACVDGGLSFEIMTFGSRVGDFAVKNGLNLGGGRTLVAVPAATNYKLNSLGPQCVAPDVTPPVIAASVLGTLGNNGWYVSDVSVTWSVTDAESPVSSSTGCGASSVTTDDAGVTLTCSATSGGGTSAQSVTIKRDATAPSVSASRAPAANANGWNNTDVTATYTAADGMSGIAGAATATQLFSAEGADQSGSRTFSDAAGNSATASVTGISIDKTAPVVTVTRSPAPGPDGWNNTDVTVLYSATDALSGIDGAASFTQVFTENGANQGGSHTFSDRAGNSATGTITGINIDKTPPPPPSNTGSASPGEIWPPNNQMVGVHVTICSGAVSYRLMSVTNNETGAADVEGWTIGSADLDGSVRAQRFGGGSGRTYTLVYDVVNAAGAHSDCVVRVAVPHDQGKKK